MKKLVIKLDDDAIKAMPFRPGDTFTGRVNFNTSTSIKYTCVKVRFVGLVSTKVAKTMDEVYVINQQTVLLGNPNNATTSTLDEGKYSWPFHFTLPLQHFPSSGKYRHGTVKYILTAIVTSTKFLGGVQDTKVNKNIDIVDHVHDSNYHSPVSIKGSSSTKMYTNNDRHLATATVSIDRTAFRPGQLLTLTIDLAHPQKIRRDPGCWIQLIRNESYSAKDQIREYSHVVAASAHAIKIDSGTHTGKIHAEITLPIDATPTMDTTKIISIQYHIMFLFDMRSQTGFFERRSKKTVNKKLREKILESPGGFEIDLPIIMDIISESRPPLEMSSEYQAHLDGDSSERDSFYANPYDSIVVATSQLAITPAIAPPVQDYFSFPSASPSGNATLPTPSTPSFKPISSPPAMNSLDASSTASSPHTSRSHDPFSTSVIYVPQTKYVRTVPPRYSTIIPAYHPRGSDSTPSSISFSREPSIRSHTLPIPAVTSSMRISANPIDLYSKPLPTLPPSVELDSSSSTMGSFNYSHASPSLLPSNYGSYSADNVQSIPIYNSRNHGSGTDTRNISLSSSPAHSSRMQDYDYYSYRNLPEKSAPLTSDSLNNPFLGSSTHNATAPTAADIGVDSMSSPNAFAYIPSPSTVSPTLTSNHGSSVSGSIDLPYSSQSPQQSTMGIQQLPPQPAVFRNQPILSASAPRQYSHDYS